MIEIFANNQELTSGGNLSEVYTDPVELFGNDRVAVAWTVHSLWAFDAGGGGATGTAGWRAQVSNDGVYWNDASDPNAFDNVSAATGITPRRKTFAINGQFLRLQLNMVCTAGDLAGSCVDIHTVIDHA